MRLAHMLLVTAIAASITAQGTKTMERFPLKHVSAEQAFEKVRARKLERVDYLTYDPSQNMLVVRGTKSGIMAVRELLAKIDVPGR